MNLNQVINLLLRKFMGRAINAGIDYAARRGKPVSEMTKSERAQAGTAKKLAQNARQIRNATRRFF
jgi:hypothetical protein